MAFTQVNYVNSRGSRALLQAGDVLNIHELNRAYAQLLTLGAPRFMGDEMTDTKLEADAGGARASSNPRGMPHYTSVLHPFVASDLRENQPIQYAWSHSDINRLYNFELGEWSGIRFCMSNMVPFWARQCRAVKRLVQPGADRHSGHNSYYIMSRPRTPRTSTRARSTQSPARRLLPARTARSRSRCRRRRTTPSTSTSAPPLRRSISVSPRRARLPGPLQGQAMQLAGGTPWTITGLGAFQVPPASPNTGITVYPTSSLGAALTVRSCWTT